VNNQIAITIWNEDGDEEEEIALPSKFEVCGNCEGHGTHLREAIREHAYTAEEFAEAFDDDESREAYFKRGGIYDVTCETCHGARVVAVVDYEKCTKEQKAIYETWLEQEGERRRMDHEDRETRRAEDGYRW
jgi:hypothetical protein